MRAAVTPLTNAEKAIACAAFQSWEYVTIIDFTEIDPDNADIIVTVTDFASDPDLDETLGFAYQPEGDVPSGDIFIDNGETGSVPLHIHEIGHSLGLEHSFEGDRIFGDVTLDRIENTIMGEANFENATGPGRFDIQAIAAMYGAPPVLEPATDATRGADALIGGSGRDQLSGLGGADTLSGLGGADELNGDGGRDLLNGGGGRDTLDGGNGADVLDGGLGRNVLIGGRGTDTFFFQDDGPRDMIKDFLFDVDQIEILGANSFDDLAFFNIAAGAIIQFENIRVLVEAADADDFIEDDFIF